MVNFEQNWSSQPTVGIVEKIGNSLHKEEPLKPRVEGATRKLNHPISKLDSMTKQLDDKDKRLFQRIVVARQNHELSKAKILANELVELRKNKKVVDNMRLSIERVQMRLSTVNELGDAMYALGPAISAMKTIGPALAKFMPEADAEFASMGNMLNGLMADSFEGSFENNLGSNEEADLILQEASAVAGNRIGEKFPSVPVSTGSGISSNSLEQY